MNYILVIEDDTDINNMIASALTKSGYGCKQAFSRTEAMLYLDSERFRTICQGRNERCQAIQQIYVISYTQDKLINSYLDQHRLVMLEKY